MKLILALLTVGLIPGLIIYTVIVLTWRKLQWSGRASHADGYIYEIYSRKAKCIAVRTDRPVNNIMGGFIAGLPLLAIPVMCWRYGAKRGIWIGVAPWLVLIIMSISAKLGSWTWPATLGSFFARLVIGVASALFGIAVASVDARWRKKCLRARGWLESGSARASCAKTALKAWQQIASSSSAGE